MRHDTLRIEDAQCVLHRTGVPCIAKICAMIKPSDRLKQARESAGFENAADFARAHDIPEPTYRAHENGTRSLTTRAARQYAPLLNISPTWLLFGESSHVTEDDLDIIQDLQDLPESLRKTYREMLRSQAQMARALRRQDV